MNLLAHAKRTTRSGFVDFAAYNEAVAEIAEDSIRYKEDGGINRDLTDRILRSNLDEFRREVERRLAAMEKTS